MQANDLILGEKNIVFQHCIVWIFEKSKFQSFQIGFHRECHNKIKSFKLIFETETKKEEKIMKNPLFENKI